MFSENRPWTLAVLLLLLVSVSPLLADGNPQSPHQAEEQAIATFHLKHLHVKDAMTVLRSILGAKNIAAVESNNIIIMRDRLAIVELAEKIVVQVDVPGDKADRKNQVLRIGTEMSAPPELDEKAKEEIRERLREKVREKNAEGSSGS